uniref:MAK10-like protein n=1 Tax=Tanacetum cinerariifolium TaxID=118510 RepID=A0A6L2LK59_TANCI|nr:hypothetical protein [Tanacetum cinerariifolium]
MSLSLQNEPLTSGKLCNINAKESWELFEDLTLCDNESWNDLRDFAKPVKAISFPQYVSSISDSHLIKFENQVQRLMEAHLALTTAMENPEQAFLKYASSRTDKARERLVSNFMASQDARLSNYKVDFKQQQSEMTNKINTVLKAITDRIVGALPRDTVKNPKLNVNSTTSVLSARSYPIEDPQCSTHTYERERYGNPEDTDIITHNEEQRDTPQLELKDTTVVDNLGPNMNDEGIEWLDVEEPLDLVDTSEESVYESLIKDYLQMPYMDPKKSELSSKVHDLLSSRIILSEDDYDRGCRKPSDLKDGLYRDTIMLGPEYVTGMDDEGQVT